MRKEEIDIGIVRFLVRMFLYFIMGGMFEILEKYKSFVSDDMRYGIDFGLKNDILDEMYDTINNREYVIGLGIGFAFKIGNKKIINKILKMNQTLTLYNEINKNV